MTKYQDKEHIEQQKNSRPASSRGKSGKRRRGWAVVLLIAAGVTVSVLLAATREVVSDDVNADTVTVRRGVLTITVTEGGSIRAHNSIQYKCQVERRRGVEVTILNIVPAGTYVTQEDVDNGMVLVELDSSSLEDQLQEEEMELASDQENYTAAKEAYDIQVIQNESDLAAGRLQVRFALLDLQKYVCNELARQMTEDVNEASSLTEHVAPFLEQIRNDPNILEGSGAGQELKQFQDDIVLASGNLKTAQDTLAGSERLHDANYVSDLELERDRLNVTSRKFAEENAEVSQNLFLSYDFPKMAEQYLSDYIEAQRELQRTYAQCRSRLAQAQARLSNTQERLQSQQKYVQDLNKQISYCTIRARAPGLVIYGTGGSEDAFRAMRGGGSGIIDEGEVVYEGQTIISMPDTAAMVAEVSVHETEVDKVNTGQPATIIMDAFPDRILRGQVYEVAPLPDQQRGWMNPDLKVYETLVSIDGTHDFLRTRMSCKVEILVRELKDVVIVPIQVVANRRGRKVCYVMTEKGPQEREVQTGAFTQTLVQIISGLQEGEKVLLNPPLFVETGAEPTFMGRSPTAPEPSESTEDKQEEPEPGDDKAYGPPSDGSAPQPGDDNPPPRRRPSGRPGGQDSGQEGQRGNRPGAATGASGENRQSMTQTSN